MVYCQSINANKFAVGLNFLIHTGGTEAGANLFPRKVLIDRAAIRAVGAAILPSAKLKSNRKEFVMENLTIQEASLFVRLRCCY